jgi:hypothetical protein
VTPEFDVMVIIPKYKVYEDDRSEPVPMLEMDSVVDVNSYDPEGYDGYITAQVLLPKGDEFNIGTVVRRCVDENGNPTGKSKPNPILDTREYEVG